MSPVCGHCNYRHDSASSCASAAHDRAIHQSDDTSGTEDAIGELTNTVRDLVKMCERGLDLLREPIASLGAREAAYTKEKAAQQAAAMHHLLDFGLPQCRPDEEPCHHTLAPGIFCSRPKDHGGMYHAVAKDSAGRSLAVWRVE